MPPDGRLRVGIAGAGSMGRAHAEALRRAGATLVGVQSPGGLTAAALAAASGTRAYDDYDRLLDDVDVVDLCVPTPLHRELTERAASRGVHVLCEKPIALSPADARAMIDACRRAGVRLFVAMVVRFMPAYRAAERALRDGRIGQPRHLRLRRATYQPDEPGNWFRDESRSGGVLVDLLIHDFDVARWLLGTPAWAFTAERETGVAPLAEVRSVLGFEGGAVATVEGGWSDPRCTFENGFQLAGSKGLLSWRNPQPSPVLHAWKGGEGSQGGTGGLGGAGAPGGGSPPSGLSAFRGVPLAIDPPAGADPYTLELRHALDAMTQGTPFEVTAEDALAALALAGAARASLRAGRPVDASGRAAGDAEPGR